MCRIKIAISLLILAFIQTGISAKAQVWVADNGDGTFKNPVIHADYSDPDVIRVSDDYFMVSSSFNHVPGLPILQSKDLVNWTLIGHALNRQTPIDYYNTVQHGGGVWAPSIRYHNNEFYIYYPDPDFGIYLIKAKSILGPWTEPVMVDAGKGLIDPCPLWDDDGRVYLVHAYAGSRAGIKSLIVIKELNKEGTYVISSPVMVYDGHEKDPTIEGPKLYKRNGYYYIFAPAGGVSTGWQTVLRAKNIYGPYEREVVMAQGSSSINGPHQGAWIDTKTGENWFLHFQDNGAYGRVVHLQPMKWINDWPVIGIDIDADGIGEPVSQFKKPDVGKLYPITTIAESDEFTATRLGLQWQWQANPKEGWAFPTSSGSLRMFSVYQPDSVVNLWNTPNILAQKLPAEEFTATIKFNFKPKFINERFGLLLFGLDYASISIVKEEKGLSVVFNECGDADKPNSKISSSKYAVKGETFYLQIRMNKEGHCNFSYSVNGENFAPIDLSFSAREGRWVGAKIGMVCLRNNITNDAGYADVDWFRIEKNKE